MAPRPYSFVILGATGLTGRGVLRFLHGRLTTSLKWAIVGRDQAVLERLAASFPVECSPEVVVVTQLPDSSIEEIAAQTRLLVNLAGPYAGFGIEVVRACVESGTHYLDICGELDVISNYVSSQHDAAKGNQVKIIPGAGFESLIFDIATRAAMEALGTGRNGGRASVDVLFSLRNVANERMGGSLSSGTLATFIDSLERNVSLELLFDPFCLTPESNSEQIRKLNRLSLDAWYDHQNRVWCGPLVPGPFINRAMVHRTNSLLTELGQGYGENFIYQEAMNISSIAPWPWGQPLAAHYISGLARRFVSAVGRGSGPVRDTLLALLRSQALTTLEPSEAELDGLGYQLDIRARNDTGQSVKLRLVGIGHPGYRSTANIIGEAILALEEDLDLPASYGVITPAVGFGTAFLSRLNKAGISVDIS
jgi:short subunit dehydrogenase-like uncharacterized protein